MTATSYIILFLFFCITYYFFFFNYTTVRFWNKIIHKSKTKRIISLSHFSFIYIQTSKTIPVFHILYHPHNCIFLLTELMSKPINFLQFCDVECRSIMYYKNVVLEYISSFDTFFVSECSDATIISYLLLIINFTIITMKMFINCYKYYLKDLKSITLITLIKFLKRYLGTKYTFNFG